MNKPGINAVRCFWTCGAWYSPASLGVRWFSRRHWYSWLAEVSHGGIEFDTIRGFWVGESLDEGWEHKVSKLDRRKAQGKKVVRSDALPMTPDEMQAAWDMSVEWVGTKGYDYALIRKLAMRGTFTGRMLTSIFSKKLAIHDNTRRLDCTEGLSLLLFSATNGKIDLRDSALDPFGKVTPQSSLDRARKLGFVKK